MWIDFASTLTPVAGAVRLEAAPDRLNKTIRGKNPAKCRPIPGIFFTATPRAGNRLTEAADLLIADTIDGKPVARYARIRFSAGT